ncbi:MAG: Xaa-Pro peptidase family protein [Desulforhopalus sp.]|nr:Xaa-Pro peptidase family protein [Desulforhopalus sp.]
MPSISTPLCHSDKLPESEACRRIKIFQKTLAERGLDGALIIDRADLFYFSGTGQQGWLYVPVEGDPLLMIFKEFSRTLNESPLKFIISLSGSKKIPQTLTAHGIAPPRRFGMEFDILPVAIFRQYEAIFDKSDIVDISTEIRLQRAVKSAFEIEKMRESAAGSDALHEKSKEILQAGKSELAAAGELEGYARSIGHQGIMKMRLFNSGMSFGHLMGGASAAVPSYAPTPNGGCGSSSATGLGAGFHPLEKNVPIIVDYAFASNGYISDQTRIFCIGKLPDDLQRGHDFMLEIQEMASGLCLPGAITGEIYQQLVEAVQKKGWADYFMGAGERQIRFIGHGTGLELDEFPFIALNQKLPLAAGMTLALEPKLIIPGKGIVGIENTNVITENGFEPLGHFPNEVCVLPS